MFTTYGTARVYVRVGGQYHEPLFCTCATAEEAAAIARALNRKLETT